MKTAGRLMLHARYYLLLLAEGHLNRRRFGAMLGRTALLPGRRDREIGWSTLNAILNTCFDMRLRDNKSGFILCRRDVLADILRHRFSYHCFQSLITVAAKSRGYTIREIETLFESRLVGRSFIPRIPVAAICKVLADILKAIYEYRISDQRTTILGEYLKGVPPLDSDKETMTGWRRALFSLYVWTMPLHAWLISRNVRTYYQQLKRGQWLTPGQTREIQDQKLRELAPRDISRHLHCMLSP